MNRILSEHGVGYEIRPPELVAVGLRNQPLARSLDSFGSHLLGAGRFHEARAAADSISTQEAPLYRPGANSRTVVRAAPVPRSSYLCARDLLPRTPKVPVWAPRIQYQSGVVYPLLSAHCANLHVLLVGPKDFKRHQELRVMKFGSTIPVEMRSELGQDFRKVQEPADCWVICGDANVSGFVQFGEGGLRRLEMICRIISTAGIASLITAKRSCF